MCTIFAVGNLIAKNYDSIVKDGMIFTNKRGLIKKALIMPPNKPLEWISTYGSISFSQSGREMPVSGMNEEGLVVEQATLPGTCYLEDDKPAVSCLEATQYLLDTCKTVKDALNQMDKFTIVQSSWSVHFVLYDRSSAMAIVEFLQGKMVIYQDEEIKVKALTNSSYMDLLNERMDNDADFLELDDYQKNSVSRFEIVADFLRSKAHMTVEAAFDALDKAKRPDTVWSNIYDLAAMKIYLKSVFSNKIISFDLKHFDFSPQEKNLLLELKKGENAEFEQFTLELNKKLITSFFTNEIIQNIMNLSEPEVIIDLFVNQSKSFDITNGILLRFLDGEQIEQLPTKKAHKLLVLKYLVSKFELGIDYSEGQVNAIIDAWHTFGDYFILRRELIESQLLKRLANGSKYWRE